MGLTVLSLIFNISLISAHFFSFRKNSSTTMRNLRRHLADTLLHPVYLSS